MCTCEHGYHDCFLTDFTFERVLIKPSGCPTRISKSVIIDEEFVVMKQQCMLWPYCSSGNRKILYYTVVGKYRRSVFFVVKIFSFFLKKRKFNT